MGWGGEVGRWMGRGAVGVDVERRVGVGLRRGVDVCVQLRGSTLCFVFVLNDGADLKPKIVAIDVLFLFCDMLFSGVCLEAITFFFFIGLHSRFTLKSVFFGWS